ncbi:lipoyl(octanoyl) transferase LipB [Cupriavidus pauculus]|uniref:lipoyl(octanoyl) transferase LipB n=1 Tax=Cupriavidus pauculus TaxID=82633 RepID=UPI0012449C8E|nr:lipoyl(octanoyl) transferase LipB [Cupriavidus pauculus]KAB0602646.1 lipoyl(octanoyl) transferase LipB [Cupriavidus pauculus]MCM3604214.1 lipoyl(octanoyl) transferase LipB [Cupriavidus pauculus]UAK98264.1 lipoyl(octanoyl) transferase LipB [Cupriavidus pauculus]
MHPIQVIDQGRQPYEPCFDAMRAFTAARTSETPDQIWLVEHPPVFTLGQAGDPSHLLAPDDAIPVVRIDRGGQITYHGPGQVVAYLLLDLRRRHLMVRELVHDIEQAVLDTLAAYNLAAERKPGAPGIYLSDGPHQGAKIAALGLKIRNGCSYHGVSLNVQMDLNPFLRINPCGYAGLETVDMASAGATFTAADDAGAAPLPVTAAQQPEVAQRLAAALCAVLAAREARVQAHGNAAAEAA